MASFVAGLALLASPAAACPMMPDDAPRPELALMGTIPLYWGETGDFAEALAGRERPHWARAVLERCYSLQPLDYLSDEALAGQSLLLLAQPRGFSAEENVALDRWVRSGGRLLLFADPQMTGESRFGLGDRRRPQDMALLSPILARWGLELEFDPGQEPGAQMRDIAGTAVPVNMGGQFTLLEDSSACTLEAAGIVADCRLEEGFVLMVADAAVLDFHHAPPGAPQALHVLATRAFGLAGDLADDCVSAPNVAE